VISPFALARSARTKPGVRCGRLWRDGAFGTKKRPSWKIGALRFGDGPNPFGLASVTSSRLVFIDESAGAIRKTTEPDTITLLVRRIEHAENVRHPAASFRCPVRASGVGLTLMTSPSQRARSLPNVFRKYVLYAIYPSVSRKMY